jgi:ribosome recycling factor
MSPDEILMAAEEKMIKTESVVANDFAGVRTGKASPSFVENIQVEVYGSMMRLREVASISTPEPRQLLVQPWDVSSTQAIEKAIQKANLGLSPVVQGKVIRISFPELSAERRQEFVKITKKMAEDGRVAVRHVRRDAMEELKKSVKASETSEEEQEKAEKEIQKLTDQYVAKIDAHLAHKEKEILTV